MITWEGKGVEKKIRVFKKKEENKCNEIEIAIANRSSIYFLFM